MHELRIAEAVIDTVRRELDSEKLSSVETIGLRIGVMSGVDPESLKFSFSAATSGTELDRSGLEIEIIPVQAHCEKCHKDFAVDELIFRCPACGTSDINMTRGDEIEISFIGYK